MWASRSSRCPRAATAAGDVKPPIPIFRSFSEAEAKDFYIRYLGFEQGFEHRFGPGMPLYMEVRRGDFVLHLSEHHGDGSPGAAALVEVPDVDALLAELRERGHPRLNPGIEEKPWGVRELAVLDPFGNRIAFFSPIETGD